jgi:hypothetical protein
MITWRVLAVLDRCEGRDKACRTHEQDDEGAH